MKGAAWPLLASVLLLALIAVLNQAREVCGPRSAPGCIKRLAAGDNMHRAAGEVQP